MIKGAKFNFRSFFSTWLAVYVFSLFIIVVSVIPVKGPRISVKYMDKIIHVILYGMLSLLVLRALMIEKAGQFRLISFLYAFSLGLLLEIVQIFLPYRSFELWDVLSNSLGSISGVFIGERFLMFFKKEQCYEKHIT